MPRSYIYKKNPTDINMRQDSSQINKYRINYDKKVPQSNKERMYFLKQYSNNGLSLEKEVFSLISYFVTKYVKWNLFQISNELITS